MPRYARERSMDRRQPSNVARYRQREESSPGAVRHHQDRRGNRWDPESDRRTSRSPRGGRRRGRGSPVLVSADRLRYESPSREIILSRSRDGETRTREDTVSPHFETMYSSPEHKFSDDHFTGRPSVQWTDPSQDITSATLKYPETQRFQSSQGSENLTDSRSVPEFNPESSKLNSMEWLHLLENTAVERGWKQDEKLYIMASRLSGFARQWYLTSGINCKSWSELKDAFFKAFPVQLDYHALLSKMMNRVKEQSESFSSYFLHKVALLNECEIQGVRAVSCIIAGLNSKMQQQVRMQKCEDPDQLYAYLRSISHEDLNTVKLEQHKEDIVKTDSRMDKWKSNNKHCFFCGKTGHVVANCRNMKKHKCSVCHELGHECEPLKNRKQEKLHNQVMEGSLSLTEVQSKNFTESYINGVALKTYIDFESESITIKEESALQTRLPIKKLYKFVRGFAGAALSSIGYIDTHMYIDKALANVRLSVVPDNIQSIPLVVGQAFTQQPHIVIFKDAGRIRFYQRADNGETNFEF